MQAFEQIGDIHEPLTGRSRSGVELAQETLRRRGGLAAAGVAPGDRVILGHGNDIEFFTSLPALWHLGACAVPLDPRLTPFEIGVLAKAARAKLALYREPPGADIERALSSAGCRILLSNSIDGPEDRSRSRLHLDDDALILFTSGTTGSPKGVVHTHRSLRARWVALRTHLGRRAYARTLCLLPTHFGHGLICNCLFPWLSGQTLYLLPPFHSETLMRLGALVDEHRITFFSSVPSMWKMILRLSPPPTGSSLHRAFCGSAPLSARLWRNIQEWTGVTEIFNSYGITETGSWTAGATLGAFTPEDGLIASRGARPWP